MPTALYHYLAYGLTIDSDIAMPELVAAQAPTDLDSAPLQTAQNRCIRIRLGQIDRPTTDKPADGPILWADRQDVCVQYEIGAYRIIGGREIIVDLAPNAVERTVRLYLLGPALAILLHQRRLLVVHASAVSVDGRVAVFAAEKGEGKSTLAAAMHARGHPLVTDDLLPVDLSNPAQLFVHPGFPQLKLMPEAAAQLTADPQSLPRLHPGYEKRAASAAANFPRDPLPLARIFILETGDNDAIAAIPPQQRFIELVRHSYLATLLGATGESGDHFRQVVALAQRVPVLRLRRRRILGTLAEHAKLIEAELNQPTRAA